MCELCKPRDVGRHERLAAGGAARDGGGESSDQVEEAAEEGDPGSGRRSLLPGAPGESDGQTGVVRFCERDRCTQRQNCTK